MAFIPIPSVAQVALRFTWDLQNVANVFHVRYTGSPSAILFQAIAVDFVAWWGTYLQAIVAPTVSLREVSVVDQSQANGIGILSTTGLPQPGTEPGASLPNNVTVAVKWTTGFTGRSFRGRTYHIGLTEPQVTANTVGTSALASLNTAYDALLTEFTTSDAQLVVASRYTNNAPRVTGISTLITAAAVDPIIDSQRRRLPGRGS